MRQRIEPIKITHEIDRTKTRKDYFYKKCIHTFKQQDDIYLAELIALMPKVNSITIELCDEVLPDQVIHELKWLNYYRFQANITVQNEELKEKYSICSKNITVNKTTTLNYIQLRTQQEDVIYLLGESIQKGYPLITKINEGTFSMSIPKDQITYLFKNEDSIKDPFLSKDIKHIEMLDMKYFKYNNHLIKQRTQYYIENSSSLESEYIIYSEYLYRIIRLRSKVLIFGAISSQDTIAFYYPAKDQTQERYTFDEDIMTQVKADLKTIVVDEVKTTFDDYEKKALDIEFSSFEQKWNAYDRVEISVRIIPPYIKDKKLTKVHHHIEAAQHKIESIKKILTRLLESAKTFVELVKVNELLTPLEMIKYDEGIHQFMDTANDILDLFGEPIHFIDKLKIAYEKDLKHMLSQKSFNIYDSELIKTKYLSIFDHQSKASSDTHSLKKSSLARVMQTDQNHDKLNEHHEVHKDFLLHVMNAYNNLFDSVIRIKDSSLPEVGTLYEDEHGSYLEIKYVDEVEDAKKIALQFGAKLVIDMEGML